MYQTVNKYEFARAFGTWSGGMYKTNFSDDGLYALFAHLEEYEDSTGERVQLDVVALCCEFSEYAGAAEYADDCNYSKDDAERDDEMARDEDYELRIQIEGSKGFIVQNT